MGVEDTPIVKGSVITGTIFGIDFDFVHQSTKLADTEITEVGGQGVRYTMSRRTRSKTAKNITLRQLAEQIATAHSVKLDWQSSVNPTFEHLDQTGISDYALLERECTEAGLMVSEAKGKLIIKSRDKLEAPKYTLARGKNLISYQITDVAMSGQSPEYSALLTQTNKATIDPLNSKVVVGKDNDKIKDGSVTGKATPNVSGTVKQGAANQKAGTTRIAGLPSSFTVVMTPETVAISPLDTMLTDGFGGVLDRIWLVDKITHKVGANTTTFNLLSPIDVLESNVVLASAADAGGGTAVQNVATGADAEGWVFPVTAVVGAPFGQPRGNRLHNGIDLPCPNRTPCYAARAGQITAVQPSLGVGTGGNYIAITHSNGYVSYYMHLDEFKATVGQQVKAGDLIGLCGSTGLADSSAYHLHFEVRSGASRSSGFDPAKLYPLMGTRGNTFTAGQPAR